MVGLAIICHENVGPFVSIEVCAGNAKTGTAYAGDIQFLTDIDESTVTFVAEQMILQVLIILGAAVVTVPARAGTPLITFQRIGHVGM